MNIEEAVSQALTSPHGVALKFPDAESAWRFRKSFYPLRQRRQRKGDGAWDTLAIVVPSDEPTVIHLLKKTHVRSVPEIRDHPITEASPLSPLQLPRRLVSRGRAARSWLTGELSSQRRS